MPFELPPLPYAYDALEPHIDERTMTIHHDKHHAGYVNNLNAALEGHSELQDMSALELLLNLDSVPSDIRTAVRNNGGGHVNHSLFWTSMSPDGGAPRECLRRPDSWRSRTGSGSRVRRRCCAPRCGCRSAPSRG